MSELLYHGSFWFDISVQAPLNPFEIIIPSAAHATSSLSTLLQVLAHVIAPSLDCQRLIADLFRKITVSMKDALEFILSPTCSIPLTRRANIAGVILVCSWHLKSLPGQENALDFFPGFLVRYRLHAGLNDAWEQFDGMVVQALQDKTLKNVPMSDILDVVKVLFSETWGTSGNGIRVRKLHTARILRTH